MLISEMLYSLSIKGIPENSEAYSWKSYLAGFNTPKILLRVFLPSHRRLLKTFYLVNCILLSTSHRQPTGKNSATTETFNRRYFPPATHTKKNSCSARTCDRQISPEFPARKKHPNSANVHQRISYCLPTEKTSRMTRKCNLRIFPGSLLRKNFLHSANVR